LFEGPYFSESKYNFSAIDALSVGKGIMGKCFRPKPKTKILEISTVTKVAVPEIIHQSMVDKKFPSRSSGAWQDNDGKKPHRVR